MLETNSLLGVGGSGLSGTGPGSLSAIVKELQGLNVSLVAGGSANATLTLAAIKPEDTILSALNNNAGTITDITGTVSIVSLSASGTITVGTVVAGDTVTVAGLTYTLVANGTTIAPGDYSKVLVGANANACAANLAAAINGREANRSSQITASVLTNVVTVTAVAEGTAGNSIGLTEVGSTFTVSGATLAGGAASAGIKSTGATNQVILFWFNKR